MISTTAMFVDRNAPKNAMPNKWYGYFIVESEAPWAGENYYIASIVPLTEPAPMPSQRHFLSSHGMGSALEQAIDALKSHDQMVGFKFYQSR